MTKAPAEGSTAEGQPSSFLRTAKSYFNLCEESQALSPSEATNGTAPKHRLLTISDVSDPAKLKSCEEYQHLNLTGNIISATTHIPYVVGVTQEGHFEITPRHSKLVEFLSYLSSSTKWKQTVVGWTGEVLPALSAQFGGLSCQENDASSAADGGQLGNVVIRDINSAHLKGPFVQRLKESDQARRQITVTKDQRKELETLLEHVFEDKILPVWLGDWSESEEGTLVLRDQDRWHKYAVDELQKPSYRTDADTPDSQTLKQDFADFKRMNEAVADGVLKVYNPGDIIWIHDCNLMLLPDILRQKLPSAYISYYHHVEGPLDNGPVRAREHAEVMKGLLGASVIGLPSRELRQNFEDYYRHEMQLQRSGDGLLSTAGRQVVLINVPIMLDIDALSHAVEEDDKVEKAVDAIRQRFRNQKLVVALASQDQAEAIQALLDGYEYFLDHCDTELTDKVVLLIVTTLDPPHYSTIMSSRTNMDMETSQKIVSINGRLSTAVHQPIVYLDGTSPPWDYVGLLRLADLGIVTTEEERIQAMSVEFSVAQQKKFSPLLICGQPPSKDAAEVSNSDEQAQLLRAKDTASRLEAALRMSNDEKRQNHKMLFDYFAKRNFKTFTNEFLMRACNSFARVPIATQIPELDIEVLIDAYGSTSKRLFMFDYDGTLTPIINNPDAAVPTEKLLNSLPKLATKAGNQVWIISGRSRDFLQQHFGAVDGVGLSAEHGSFIRRPGNTQWENLAARMDMQWKVEADKVFTELEKNVTGSWIERKEVAIVWHYRNARDHDACLAKAVECKALLEGERLKNWDVDVMLGKANLEVRPRFLNKGATATSLIKDIFGKGQEGFILCAGDDTTDEDMFRALLASKLAKTGVFSCLVSMEDRPSLASFRVNEPSNLVDAIAHLSEA